MLYLDFFICLNALVLAGTQGQIYLLPSFMMSGEAELVEFCNTII